MNGEVKTNNLRDKGFLEEIALHIRNYVECRLLFDEPMSGHTSFRIGGPAGLYIYPASILALSNLVMICAEKGINYRVIGFGTNLLVSDAGFGGCVIDLADACRDFRIEETAVNVGAGLWGSDIVRKVAENGLAGMERLAGIPGGLGGWIWMNCGAFQSSISEHLTTVDVMSGDGTTHTMAHSEIRFAYRSAPGLIGKTILGAKFLLERGDAIELQREVEMTIAERYRRKLMALPSAGSLFKNPPNQFAAKLIDSAGGKGMKVGGVAISENHANFVVNSKGGTAADMVELIRRIRLLVLERYDILLELELKTLGFEDNEI